MHPEEHLHSDISMLTVKQQRELLSKQFLPNSYLQSPTCNGTAYQEQQEVFPAKH